MLNFVNQERPTLASSRGGAPDGGEGVGQVVFKIAAVGFAGDRVHLNRRAKGRQFLDRGRQTLQHPKALGGKNLGGLHS